MNEIFLPAVPAVNVLPQLIRFIFSPHIFCIEMRAVLVWLPFLLFFIDALAVLKKVGN